MGKFEEFFKNFFGPIEISLFFAYQSQVVGEMADIRCLAQGIIDLPGLLPEGFGFFIFFRPLKPVFFNHF